MHRRGIELHPSLLPQDAANLGYIPKIDALRISILEESTMDEILQDDERLDYLLAKDLRIIQSPSVFSFSLDAYYLRHLPMSRYNVLEKCRYMCG